MSASWSKGKGIIHSAVWIYNGVRHLHSVKSPNACVSSSRVKRLWTLTLTLSQNWRGWKDPCMTSLPSSSQISASLMVGGSRAMGASLVWGKTCPLPQPGGQKGTGLVEKSEHSSLANFTSVKCGQASSPNPKCRAPWAGMTSPRQLGPYQGSCEARPRLQRAGPLGPRPRISLRGGSIMSTGGARSKGEPS